MTVTDLKVLFDYGHWANAKVFGVIERLTSEQFTQPISGNHGSIRNTMVHVLSAEWGWISRCGGPNRGPALNPADFPTVASLEVLWKQVEGYGREFLEQLRNEDLSREIEFAFPGTSKSTLSVGQLMQHAATHGAHHRGQVSLLLRLLDHDPDNFDMLFYQIEKRGREGVNPA